MSKLPYRSFVLARQQSEKPSLCLFQLPFLVQEALHPLFLFVAIGQDFAHGLSDKPEGVVVGVTVATEEFSRALRVAFFSEGAHSVRHVDHTGRCAVGGGFTQVLDFDPFGNGTV
jgi:hypothetical protein